MPLVVIYRQTVYMSDDISFSGSFQPVEWEEPEGWVDGAPTSSAGQSCAFCGNTDVRWVHPLDPEKVEYRAWGKGYTLPRFWALCERCEQLYQDREEDNIASVMLEAEANYTDINEDVQKPLAVFRNADQGARRLDDDSVDLKSS